MPARTTTSRNRLLLAELRARIRALVRRGLDRRGGNLRFGDLEIDRDHPVWPAGTNIPLTSKEFALIELLMLRAPESVTRSEIIEHVWDFHFDSETNLVDVYINRLLLEDRSLRKVQNNPHDSWCGLQTGSTRMIQVNSLRFRMMLLFCAIVGIFLAGTLFGIYGLFSREMLSQLDCRLLRVGHHGCGAVA